MFGKRGVFAAILLAGCCVRSQPTSTGGPSPSSGAPAASTIGGSTSELKFTQYWGLMGGSGFELTICPSGLARLHRLSSESPTGRWFAAQLAKSDFVKLSAAVETLRQPGQFRVCADGPDFHIQVREPPLYLTECAEGITESRFGPVYKAVAALLADAVWERLAADDVDKSCPPSGSSPSK